jgi:hypothetical protein
LRVAHDTMLHVVRISCLSCDGVYAAPRMLW